MEKLHVRKKVGIKIFSLAVLIALTVLISSLVFGAVGNPFPQVGDSTPLGSSGEAFPDTGSGYGSYQAFEPSFNSFYTTEQMRSYWPRFIDMQNDQCTADSDFLVMIPPGGCSPMVVRSDLLEEQNVPVFCQLDALRVNPLIKVSSIKSITFQGDYPPQVAGISFHPARAAIRTHSTLLGSPLINNIGYVVIILKQEAVEDNMPEWVAGNLTATVHYDAENIYGTGRAEYYVPVLEDQEWDKEYEEYSFWQGRGFVRVTDIEGDSARIALYTDKENIQQEITLRQGETSSEVYFPGFYCRAGLQVKLNNIDVPAEQARLNIDGDNIWVRKGAKILNEKCRVTDLVALDDGTGSVKISCPGQKISLSMQKRGAMIAFGDAIAFKEDDVIQGTEYQAGAPLFNDTYLAYIGKVPSTIDDNNKAGKNFILLVKSDKSFEQDYISSISKEIQEISKLKKSITWKKFEDRLGGSISGFLGKQEIIAITEGKGNSAEFAENKIMFVEMAEDVSEAKYDTQGTAGQLVEDYYSESDLVLSELLDDYPYDKREFTIFSENALWAQIDLAKQLGKQESARDYLQTFIETYPDSATISRAKAELANMDVYDMSSSHASVFVTNNYYQISVNKFKDIKTADRGVQLIVGGNSGWFDEGDKISLGDNFTDFEEGQSYVRILKINVDSVDLVYKNKSIKSEKKLGSFKERESVFREKEIVVRDINVKEVAYISLIPKIKNTKTEANFTFKVGIEKRGIELSPEKTQEMIDNLEDSIERWENINEKLGNVIKGWKGACFATSSVLMLKNLVSGFSGEAMARQKVMAHYSDVCESLISDEKKYNTKTQCYNALSEDINSDVSAMTSAIQNINSKISTIEESHKTAEGFLGLENVIDTEAALSEYRDGFGDTKVQINVGGKIEEIAIKDLETFEQVRTAELLLQLKGQGNFAEKVAQSEADEVLSYALRGAEINSATDRIKQTTGFAPEMEYIDREGVTQKVWSGQKVDENLASKISSKSNLDIKQGETPVQFVRYNGEDYAVILETGKTGELRAQEVYSIDSSGNINKIKITEQSNIQDLGQAEVNARDLKSKYTFIETGLCKNPYKSPKARFYETSPDARMPAIIPFDLDDGWYVRVPQAAGGLFSAQEKGYTESGDISFFYICNVGHNGKEENMGGDDLCQSFDVNTYDRVKDFGGCALTQSEITNLVKKARAAVKTAAQQYSKGHVATIKVGNKEVEVTEPMNPAGEVLECQDFMSPEDCQLMFNVCDPVICPASRCNLGGAYPVANVVQTGIIGSIALCLPNIQEGIMVPICLTGVHAGVDGFISILKSEKECLQESLDTGQHVGICDEITSIYMCEFFWRQLAPLARVIIPKLFEFALGQGTRGGGEYLTVTNSWSTLQQGIDYYKDSYAQNAFRAFEFRNVEEAGGEFCKAFVGTSLPTSAEMLDSLLEPESPEQFNAWFEEIPFTEATVPATSHYKVYYHIYAGNDRGAQYAVYLRNPPASGYYSVNPQVMVEQSYIALGKEADEAIDFTAPSGYKELCVVINAQTHCGFGSVSTSFALDYIKKKEIQDQAEQKEITTEKECISGSPSVWSIVNPNLQAGVEEVIDPQIAMDGIVRVCSTENPGRAVEGEKGTDSRWVDVGYCGNTNIKCWIDSDSVKKDLEQINAIEGTTSELLEMSNQARVNGTLTEIDSVEEVANLRKELNKIELALDRDLKDHKLDLENYIEGQINMTVKRLRRIYGHGSDVGVGFLNSDKAEAMALERDVYGIVIRALMELNLTEVKAAVEKAITDAKVIDEVVSTTSASGEQNAQDEESVAPAEEENVELEVIESTDFSGAPTIGNGKAQGGIYIGGVDTGLYLSRLATVERGYQIINKRGLGIFEFVIKDYVVGNVFSNDHIAFYENEISSNEKIKNINNILKNYCFDTIRGEEFYPKLAGSCGGIEDEAGVYNLEYESEEGVYNTEYQSETEKQLENEVYYDGEKTELYSKDIGGGEYQLFFQDTVVANVFSNAEVEISPKLEANQILGELSISLEGVCFDNVNKQIYPKVGTYCEWSSSSKG